MENPFELINERLDRIEKLLTNINDKMEGNNGAPTPSLPNIMNIEQVADYISLSKHTVYGLVHKREIPHFKKGKRLYFDKKNINEWLLEGKVSTRKDIEEKVDEYLFRNPLW
ncbi:helix-turn-helix domain-containing protein [Mangrovimonas xylaniphaga]|uniref:helix-turn-helix domain-containing protein n=1 Tax=Mangrovimonas xylaniphaga TaxID=1645915 RepID=UPI0006B66BEB|nr:helix-turn-helix domain-containing protein [Mangrovimonas xylaniphaga]